MPGGQTTADVSLYDAFAVARALVANRPYALEAVVEDRRLEQELGLAQRLGWRRIIRPPETEEGLERVHKNSPFYIYLGGLSGRFTHELPPGESLIATIEIRTVNRVREWLSGLVQGNFPGDPRDPVPPGLSERPVRRIRNSLIASEPGHCKQLLRELRTGLLQHGPFGWTATNVLASARDHISSLRAELGTDVHLPSALIAIADLLQEIEQHDAQFDPMRRFHLLRPLFDEERILHPTQLLREVTAIAVSMGLLQEVRKVADGYRDLTSEARMLALSAKDNEGMLATLFEVLPKVFAANDIYQTLKLLKGDLGGVSNEVIESVARATDEELIRFSHAFAIQFAQLFQGGLDADLSLVQEAVRRGGASIAEVRATLEGQFSYPSSIVEALFERAVAPA